MTTQDKPAVGPLSAGDLVQHVVAKNMFRVIRRIDGEWPDVWLNMVGEPHQAHMADRWVFVARPDPDGWIPWSGGKNPVPGQRVEVKIRWRNGRPSEGAVASDHMRWSHGTRGSGGGDIIAFRLAPTAPDVSTKPLETDTSAGRVKETAKTEHVTAPVEAGGSERDEAAKPDPPNRRTALMAQDEKMLAADVLDRLNEMMCDCKADGQMLLSESVANEHGEDLQALLNAYQALSAAPAQPAAVEGAGEPVAWAIFWRHGVTTHPTREAALAAPGRTVQEPVALYARPSPTPAADADADEMAKAVERLKADADYFDHPEDGAETHRRALCWVARDIRTVLGLAALKSTAAPKDGEAADHG